MKSYRVKLSVKVGGESLVDLTTTVRASDAAGAVEQVFNPENLPDPPVGSDQIEMTLSVAPS